MENIILLPLSNLHESPSNPRKHFDQVGLQELANSLLSLGVMSPIVVRPHPAPSMALHHQIVFGHRRFRAAKLAEFEDIPCIIRDMTDQQVAQAQLHENLERQDVTMLEEAEAFAALMTTHGVKVEALEEQTGKSRAYIYAALQLNKLTPEARELVNTGKIGREIAQRLGRVPAVLQPAAIKAISYEEYSTKEVVFHSSRQAIANLKNFTRPLAGAEFNSDALNIAAWSAGEQESPSCTNCSFNSSNNEALQADLGAGVCTNRPCFDRRVAAHTAAELEAVATRIQAWKDAGGLVIEGEERRLAWPNGYSMPHTHTCIDDDLTDDAADGTIREALTSMGTAAPATTRPLVLREYVKDDDIPKLLAHMGLVEADEAESTPPPAARANTGGAADADEDEAHSGGPGQLPLPLTPEEEAVRQNWGQVLRATIRAAQTAPRTTDELRLIIAGQVDAMDEVPAALAEAMGWDDLDLSCLYRDDVEWLLDKLPTMTANELGGLAVAFALIQAPVNITTQGQRWAAQVALAKTYGVNPLDPDAPPAVAASTPTPAAQAPKGAAPGRSATKARAPATAALDLGDASATQEGDDQASFAGKVIEGVGSAAAPASATAATPETAGV